jgi:multidrug resistance efflux pump
MMRHDTCTDEARCHDYPLCRHRGFPLDDGDTGAAISPKPYREAIGSFVGTVIALSATERERDELQAEVERLRATVEQLRSDLEFAYAKQERVTKWGNGMSTRLTRIRRALEEDV